MDDNIGKKLGAEFLGTFRLVLGGCGSAIFAAAALGTTKDVLGIGGAKLPVAGVVNYGIGYMGVALAFGLIWYMWWLAALSFIAIIVVSIVHTFNYNRDYYIPADDVVAEENKRTELLARQV